MTAERRFGKDAAPASRWSDWWGRREGDDDGDCVRSRMEFQGKGLWQKRAVPKVEELGDS